MQLTVGITGVRKIRKKSPADLLQQRDATLKAIAIDKTTNDRYTVGFHRYSNKQINNYTNNGGVS
jgi:hypothetical protein